MNLINKLKLVFGKLFALPWYFLAFSAYPVFAMLSFNVGQVEPDAGSRVLLASVLFGALLFILFWIFLRQVHRAAFLSLLWQVLFFTYGHVYNLINEKAPDFNPTPWMLAGWAVWALLAVWWATRPKLGFASAAAGLNGITLVLLIISLGQTLSGSMQRSGQRVAADHAPIQQLHPPAGQPLPDVYYFILDSYGRADLLQQAYQYDNSQFISTLEARGFYVAKCSQSNYPRTDVSVGSSLNLLYLQNLDSTFTPDNTDRTRLWDALRHNTVRYNLESIGYQTVAFSTGFDWSELRDADMFYSPPPFSSGLTEFEGLFMRSTLARYAEELGWVNADTVSAQNFRERFNMVFNSLDGIARNPDPTLAYIHVISPHPPFVFGPNGENTDPAQFWNDQRLYLPDPYAKGYQNQLTNLNKKMEAAIDTILADSSTPPIIIIQGDHGPWLQPTSKKFSILNAYYLPGHNAELYPSVSPVNSFRLVFDDYFGANYPLLRDVTYDSPVPNVFKFTEIPNKCQ